MQKRNPPVAALYARYSDPTQSATSIDDQVRRCRDVARSEGLVIKDELQFIDRAISGKGDSTHLRTGFAALRAAIASGEFDVLITDEVSRIARDSVELAELKALLVHHNVRFIAANGIDSANPNWELYYEISSALATHHVRELRFRVERGMKGALERGFMLAAPPFGYRLRRLGEEDAPSGAIWEIHAEEADVVRKMYERRATGASYSTIARWLKTSGIQPPRKPRKYEHGYWRAASVYRMLHNPIYRGVYVWQGSAFLRAKAKKTHRILEPLEYSRPQLRIVPDALWWKCVGTLPEKQFRGGRRHLFAGLVRCGMCEATLCVRAHAGYPAQVSCAQCGQAKTVGHQDETHGYVSLAPLIRGIRMLLDQAFGPDAFAAFRERIRAQLQEPLEAHLAELRRQLAVAERSYDRLVRLLRDVGEDAGSLEREVRAAHAQRSALAAKVTAIEARAAGIDRQALQAQLTVDPRELLGELLSSEGEDVGAAQVALQQVLPHIRLIERPRRFHATFEVHLVPSAAAALASATQSTDRESEVWHVRVLGRAPAPANWIVEVVRVDAKK